MSLMKLPTNYQEFIHKSRYSRWLEEEKRRESWDETVNRYITFMFENTRMAQFGQESEMFKELKEAIINLEIILV